MPPEPARPPPPRAPLPEAPTVAFFLAFLGGVLVMVESLALLAGGTAPYSVGISTTVSESAGLGGLGVAVGIGIVAAGFAVQENVAHRIGVGVVLLVLGSLSVLSGGGFGFGLGLAVAGGLISILLRPTNLYEVPPDAPRPAPGRPR